MIAVGRLALCAVLATAAGCMDVERDDPSVVPDDQMSMNLGNYTDRALALFVNDQPFGVVPRGVLTLEAEQLPPLPWHAELRLPSGRTAVQVTIRSGSVRQTETSSEGVAARMDLSCGRVDIWSGFPLSGPPPGPGKPGDCD